MTDAQLQAAMAGYEKCARLLANPDVQWLLEESIHKPLKEAQEKLESLGTSKDDREAAAHVREALKTAEQFLQKQSDIFFRALPNPQK